MKLTLLLILLSLFSLQASVFSQNSKLNFEYKNVTVKELLRNIEDNSEFRFAYSSEYIELDRKVDVKFENENISTVLNEIFKDTNVGYSIDDRVVILYKKGSNTSTTMQQKSISGKVTDDSGLPLPGVAVIIKGTATGTVTDMDGNFYIEVNANDILVFSFVGMKSQDVPIADKQTLNVTMKVDAIGIEEVVAIGYGTKLKGEVTGSISKVDDKIFESRPVSSTLNALQGAMPGVVVTRGSSRPGNEGLSFNIRGVSSIAGNSPLILIDGIPGDLNTLNPSDIESVTVLKDAAASIYGARAADGVLLVTTQKGVVGDLSVEYTVNYGLKSPTYLGEMTNTLQMAEMYDEGMRNIGQPGVSQEVFDKIKSNAAPDLNGGWMKYLENYPGFYGSHNWPEDIFGTGKYQQHNLTVSGGTDKTNYLLSVGYKKDQGLLDYGENKAELFNLRFNYGFKLFNDRLSVDTRTSFDDNIIIEPSAWESAVESSYLSWSYVPVRTPSGQFYWYQNYQNPAQLLVENGTSKTDIRKFQTNIKAELKVSSDLKLISQVGVNITDSDANSSNRTFELINWQGSVFGTRNNPNSASFSNSKNIYGSYIYYIDYNKSLNEKHRINVMAGGSHEQNEFQSQYIRGYNYKSNDIFTLNLADKTDVAFMNYTGSRSDWALNSFFGRLSYAYQSLLNVDFTTRLDGSSKFAPNKRWSALFPALSGALNLTDQSFIKELNTFDLLKFRASWGKSGNQNLSFGNYDYIPLISISGNYPLGNPNAGLPGAVASIASESRTWETVETVNGGIDFAFFNARLNGSFDYFIKKNNNMLVGQTLPATLGGSAPTLNLGKLETKGWDLALTWTDSKGDFKYSVSAILSDAKNKLVKVEGNDSYSEGLVFTREGYPLNSYFGYESDGFIQNESELNEYKKLQNIPVNIGLGDAKYKDLDGDGKITAFGDPTKGTTGDMKYLGDTNPRYTYSTNINLSYKNFDFSMLLQGVGKRVGVREGVPSMPLFFVWHQSISYFYGKTWTPDRPDAEFPRIIPGGVGWDALRNWNYRYSDRTANKLSYLRAKSIVIAYNLPKSLCSRVKMDKVRIYASGEDLFTISKGTWGNSYDPESLFEGRNKVYKNYPFTKVMSLGLEVKF